MISVVIPHWPIDPEKDAMLERCANSLTGHDELIVIVNDGIGFAKAVNRGLKLARGDYICIVNNDTTLASGSLQDLAVLDTVTVPKITGQVDNKPRAFYCIPRTVIDKIGYLDESYEIGYWEDDDYIRRMTLNNVPINVIDKVQVDHIGGATMKHTDQEKLFNRNKGVYEKKWLAS